MTIAEKTLSDAITKLNAEYAELTSTPFSLRALPLNRVQRAWGYAKTWASIVYPTLTEKEQWDTLRACVPAINTRFHA